MVFTQKTIKTLNVEDCHSKRVFKVYDPAKPKIFWFVSQKEFWGQDNKRSTPMTYAAVITLKKYLAFTKRSLEKMIRRITMEWCDYSSDNGTIFIRWDSYNDMYYKLDEEIPMSIPYKLDYMLGNINSREFDLDKAVKILSRKKYVSDIKICDYPGFCDMNHDDRYISCIVLFPQYIFAKMCQSAKMSSDHWTSTLKDLIVFKQWLQHDFIGVKDAYKGEKKQSWE